MIIKYRYRKIKDEYIFKTEIFGKEIRRAFTKDSFSCNKKEDELIKLMLRSFKTLIVTTIRDSIKLEEVC